MSSEFNLPPRPKNEAGEMRAVGLEFEFAAEEVHEVVRLVPSLFSGKTTKIDPHRFKIDTPSLGSFTVELDSQYAHLGGESKESLMETLVPEDIRNDLLKWMGDMMKVLVPYEVVTPPIPFDRLDECNPLVDGLRRLNAKGTDENPFYAFGMHLNPEVATLDSGWILNILKAYLLLAEGLHEKIGVDWARKISPYIQPFSSDYMVKVLNPDYHPDTETFVRDFIEFNPTRNRELDFLPLFYHWQEELMQSLIEDNLTKPRPTFHFRLPDFRLNDPEWSLAQQWNLWVKVEELAEDEALLRKMSETFLDHEDEWFSGDWAKRIPEFVQL